MTMIPDSLDVFLCVKIITSASCLWTPKRLYISIILFLGTNDENEIETTRTLLQMKKKESNKTLSFSPSCVCVCDPKLDHSFTGF